MWYLPYLTLPKWWMRKKEFKMVDEKERIQNGGRERKNSKWWRRKKEFKMVDKKELTLEEKGSKNHG